jgi:hypothetical protein
MAFGQRISGSYYGRGEAKTGLQYNSYLCELIIEKKGNNITGELNYFFGQNQYQSKLTGIFLPATKTIDVKPMRLISFFAQDAAAPDCIVDGSLTLYIEGADTILYGQLNPIEKYRNGCPVINIGLKKTKDVDESIAALERKEIPQASPQAKSINTIAATALPSITDVKPAPAFVQRKTEPARIIDVQEDTVLVHLYDNGKIDKDTISVYYNQRPVLVKQMLGIQPIELRLPVSEGFNEIAMFAENLGEIPPNTALCIVYADGKRYDINLTSTLATNGAIQLRRQKKQESPQ